MSRTNHYGGGLRILILDYKPFMFLVMSLLWPLLFLRDFKDFEQYRRSPYVRGRGEIFLTHLSHPCRFWKLEQSKGKHVDRFVGNFLSSEPSLKGGRERNRDQKRFFCCGKWFCLGLHSHWQEVRPGGRCPEAGYRVFRRVWDGRGGGWVGGGAGSNQRRD